MYRILIADDNEDMCDVLSRSLAKRGFEVSTSPDGAAAAERIQNEQFDVILSDLRMPNLDGIGLLKKVRENSPSSIVIMITAYGTVEDAVEAMRQGAFDYVLKPFSSEEIEIKIRKALEHKRLEDERRVLRKEAGDRMGGLICNSLRMQDVSRQIDEVAVTTLPVIICGKSGTGKEVVAREIHRRGPRSDMSFVTINCVAIDPVIQELELFGCARGAREDMPEGRKGKIEAAVGGTVFISEISELGLEAQRKLAVLLEEGTFRRVGGVENLQADVRIVASVDRKLDEVQMHAQCDKLLYDKFRNCSIVLPELKDREEDIADLSGYFADKYSAEFHKHVSLSPEAMAMLKNYGWPGNVHELENVIARAVISCRDDVVLPSHLPPSIAGAMATIKANAYGKQGVATQLDAIEKEVIRDALEKEGWNQSHAALRLGMKRTTLQYKLKKYGISKA